jgi:hypothetical protein
VKKCPKCNTDNTDSMNFCLECGSPLPAAFPTEQPTASYPNVTPTNPSQTQETKTVVSNFQPSQPTFQTPQPTVVTNHPSYNPPPSPNTTGTSGFTPTAGFTATAPPPKKGSKMIWIVGGVAAVLILGVIGIVGIGAVVLISQNNTPTPTPAPTRATPVPTATTAPVKPPPPQTSPQPSPNSTDISADYDDMTVDFNVTEGGQKGMRMHVSFTTKNMKNVESYLAIYFQKDDGTALEGKVTAYRSKSGQVAVFKLLRPAYDVAEFKDQQIFIPYTAMSLPPGKYNLQMVVNLIYKTDGLIQHLHDFDFDFEQK